MTDTSIPQKQCPKCRQFYPATLEYFTARKQRKSGLSSYCKACQKAYRSTPEYRAYNAERERIRRKRCDVKEWITEYNHQYNRAHRIEIRKQKRQYEQLNRDEIREKRRVHSNRRRALFKQANGSHTAEDIRLQYISQRGKCWHCGKQLGNDWHVDHLIPLSRGGSNAPNNLVISCPLCNMQKHNKLPQEWNGRLF